MRIIIISWSIYVIKNEQKKKQYSKNTQDFFIVGILYINKVTSINYKKDTYHTAKLHLEKTRAKIIKKKKELM